MALDTGKKITRRNWDILPISELVITRVNALGKDQPELLTFTDRHGILIRDIGMQVTDDFTDDVEFPGVDPVINDDIETPGVDTEEGPDDPTPQEIGIDDLDINQPDPAPIEVETAPNVVETVQEETAGVAPVLETVQLPEVRRSDRVKTQTKPGYIPSMTGTRYGYAVTQLESYGVLHPSLLAMDFSFWTFSW
jgi:hypothetical protein